MSLYSKTSKTNFVIYLIVNISIFLLHSVKKICLQKILILSLSNFFQVDELSTNSRENIREREMDVSISPLGTWWD